MSGIDLEIHSGEVFAFLGPNGAGKTTTVEILEGSGIGPGARLLYSGKTPAAPGANGARASVLCCRSLSLN